ncbi:unnamed protein product, partial [Lepidochelys kempii]
LTPASLSPCSLPLFAFPGEHPADGGPPPDAMTAKTTMEPAPSIIGSPSPSPLTLDSAQEALSFSCSPPAPQSLTPAPAPTPAPAQGPSSCNVNAAPGAISFLPFADPPQGAVFALSSRDPLGVAIFPLSSPSTPRREMNLITPACQTPRRWSAPCLPALADHEAILRGPSGNTSGIVTPPPHELRHALRKFLEHSRGARDRAQLALRLWGDFDQLLQATRALIKEGRGQGKRGAAAYERARNFRRDLLTHGMALRMTPLIIAILNTRGCRMALRRSQVLSYLREGRYTVVFLQETHTDPAAEDRWRLEWGDGLYFSHFVTWQAGVATLFSPNLRPEVLGVNEAVPGHVLHLRVRIEGLVVNLVNIYAPQMSSRRPQFYQQVSDFLGTLDSHEERPGPAYWHFNNSLLEDESFVMSFREFWLAWREQWRAFPSVRRWWDLGKVCAKLFCRDYTRGTSRRRNAAIEQLEWEVLEMERRLAASPEDPSLCGACREKREELRALEDHRARDAFIRSRIRLLREMDRGSRFFYALEKMRGAKKHVTCLLAEDGTPLMDPEEMRMTGLVLREPELRLVLSAYADDVLLVVQDPGDLARVEACQAIYSAASSARVNWVKSSGLAVGDWRQEE